MTASVGLKFDVPRLQRLTLGPLQWCVILIGLSLPVSVALDNVLLALVLLGALFSLGSIARIGVAHPVARAALLLFAVLLAALFWGATPLPQAVAILGKYADLLFIPIFIFLLSGEQVRGRARRAFLAAMAITLLLSYLVGLKLLPVMSWMSFAASTANPVIFHSHITQSNMMAFAVFLALLEWRAAATPLQRAGWAAFAALGTINVLFMVQGRTGYLILLVLLGWFAWTSLARAMHRRGRAWGWRQGVLLALAIAAAAVLAYHSSARLHDRVALVVSEYQAWQPGHGRLTSTGQRLDFYSSTLQIVREHPLLGVGTGGFPAAFARKIAGTDALATNNPHNEYLMVAVQTGVAGLLLLLYLFLALWRHAPQLPSPYEQDAARGLVLAYAVNCMLNSALHDHADGLLFAFMTAVLFAGWRRKA
jgi:O-antigen ligase